ncbi:MAG: ATP-binding cassette domain-containing protein [Cyclobacteriaceae bacterium]|nr:ATP-binding cassette domain-containing protein [Cyclobacteriaceae bacterium]
MSEPVLTAIMRLFALVAKEDQITKQERDHILVFLSDHLSQKAAESHMQLFDEYAVETSGKLSAAQEKNTIIKICQSINEEIAQKQKIVIVLELMSVILADGAISEREQILALQICDALNIATTDLELIKLYVLGKKRTDSNHEDILIIDSIPDQPGTCVHIYREHLDGFLAILYLRSTDTFFFKYIGRTDVYLNGVPQKSGSINVLATGSTMRWDGSPPIYYGEVLGLFKKLTSGTRTSFEAKKISYQFKNGRLGLRDVDVSEESGNLVALMGASGAGKSTLLHVLNGSEKPSAGSVLINGIDIYAEPKRIEGVIGFVPQDDLLIEDLTVYQNLYFSAKLCFSHLNEKEIDELVLKTLSDLGLTETKHLTVGSPLRKTISGGQRKRLNIGLELLREPAVLFVDEPTSGLSSRDSENIIDLLKELSLKGKLVFAVIHQPSSDIFKMFDKLVILDTGGYQIYYGNPVDAITYFKKNINLVNSDQGECFSCGNVNPEQIFNIIETKVINEFGNFTDERKFSAEQWNQQYKDKIMLSTVIPSEEVPQSTLRVPSWSKQIKLFGLRDLLAKLSNTQYLVINLLEAPLLAFILAFIVRYYNTDDVYNTGYVFSKNLNMPAYLFMSVIVALFMGLTVSAEEIIRDRKILKREKFLHLNRSSYILSKIGILFMISALQTLLFVLVGNTLLEIKGMYLIYWCILFSTSCFANLLGLNISSAFNSAVTIYILIPILLIPQLILSGVVVKFDKLNPVIGNTETVPLVGDIMASRWAFEASMVAQYKDNEFEKMFYFDDKVMADADYKKIYLIPALETRLDFVNLNIKSQDPSIQREVINDLALLKHELTEEIDFVGKKDFAHLNDFTIDRYDSSVYEEAAYFLGALKKFYVNRYNKADEEKDKKINELTNTPEKEKAFEEYRNHYQNEAITELVKNTVEQNRIIEKNGKLIQKIFPIYKDPDPEHLVDFDAQFYMPAKHFLNQNIDTFYFNLGVIWSMTFLLAITLYFDILRKIVDGLGNISNPIPKRM